jgi:hypothetical protein
VTAVKQSKLRHEQPSTGPVSVLTNPPELLGCREKLDWAAEHIKLIRVETEAWLNANPVELPVTEHLVTGYHPHVISAATYFAKPPERFGVLIGNVLHNLRSALDHLVWQLVLLNGGAPLAGAGGNTFPIYDAPQQRPFLVVPPSGLRGVKPYHRAFIESVQPYKVSPNDVSRNALRVLRELSDTDKHQLLHVTNLHGRTDRQIPVTFDLLRCRLIAEHYPPLIARLYDGAVFAVLEVVPIRGARDSTVKVQGRFPVQLTIEHAGQVLPVTWSLSIIHIAVKRIIDSFNPAFEGEGDPVTPDSPQEFVVNFPV